MYNIFMTIVSVLLIYVGLQNLTGGYLWMALVVAGGFYLGHVVTVALNETSAMPHGALQWAFSPDLGVTICIRLEKSG